MNRKQGKTAQEAGEDYTPPRMFTPDMLNDDDRKDLVASDREPDDYMGAVFQAIAFQPQGMDEEGTLQCVVVFQIPAGTLKLQEDKGKLSLMPPEAQVKELGLQLAAAVGVIIHPVTNMPDPQAAPPPAPFVRVLMRKDSLGKELRKVIEEHDRKTAPLRPRINIPK
jgi:hypothetical protein